jgi:predicted ArsR family transcriptional regulator
VTDADPHRILQRQARALGDPTRYRIFRFVAAASGPVSVAAITAHVELHHNGIRQHLAKLCDAGLLIEELGVRTGRGRPALQYRLAPGGARFLL